MTKSTPHNPALARLRSGEVALGLNVRLTRSPEIARLARASGHDFLFIDAQHAIFNLETIVSIASTALACGVACTVRVRSVDDPNVGLLLDNGVTGIIFPDIETAADARKAVATCRLGTLGNRSLTGAYPQFDFAPTPIAEAVAALDQNCLVGCMIESPAALNNVEAIAAVEGFDVLHLGANDLLSRMGKPGQFDDPDIIEAQERVIAAARAHGKYPGLGGHRDIEGQVRSIARGARFLTTQSDTALLASAAKHWVGSVRQQIGHGPEASLSQE